MFEKENAQNDSLAKPISPIFKERRQPLQKVEVGVLSRESG